MAGMIATFVDDVLVQIGHVLHASHMIILIVGEDDQEIWSLVPSGIMICEGIIRRCRW